MPHSIKAEPPSSQPGVKDEPMDDAGIANTVAAGATNDDDNDDDIDMLELKSPPPSGMPKEDLTLDASLFPEDESDEEFPSSMPVKVAPSSPVPMASLPTDVMSMKASDPEVMRSFYQRLFPWRPLFQWLNHGPVPSKDYMNREFAFTLSNDAYLRYQSFKSSDTLRSDVLRLMPSRFEIGPVYSANPRDRKTIGPSFKPLAKELCFDIDLTDYDDIRTCCDKANICNKCWTFMTMAIKVLDIALRDDFGFKHIMWVYSGRRGAHAWVCDKAARRMDDQKRKAIAGYLEVIKGGAQSGKKVNVWRPLHPHLSRSLDILKTHFQEDILAVQDPWDTEERFQKLLALLPDHKLNESLRKKWDAAPGRSSTSKWLDIDALAKTGASKNLDAKALLEAKQDIVLEYTYPRLDIEVSKKLNHLLKSPFVVHPGTGRVCVPIDTTSYSTIEAFDPMTVPTVQALLGEIDAWKGDDAAADGKTVADWEKTSLKPYIEYFRTFVAKLNRDEEPGKVKREREDEGMDF